MFKTLAQEHYKDENGHDIPASEVRYLGPYRHLSDGFYRWECGQCQHEHSNRAGWSISGQVMRCDKCGQMSLLVRTNTVEVSEALAGMWRAPERDAELKRLEGLELLNREQIGRIRRELLSRISSAVESLQTDVAVDPHAPSTGTLTTRA